MEQPDTILESGTVVFTHENLTAPSFLIKGEYLDERRSGKLGVIVGVVGGHGGDVYWVRHCGLDTRDRGPISAYGFWEFELSPDSDSTSDGFFWDHLNRDVEY